MQRDEDPQAVLALQPMPALRHHGHRVAHQLAGGRRTQGHDGLRLHVLDLALEPVQACRRLALCRRLVHASLAAHLELEVLDGIGEIQGLARPAQLLERAGQQVPRGTDERVPLAILLVARLLAHEHQRRAHGAFAPHGLRGGKAEGALAAAGGGLAQRLERV